MSSFFGIKVSKDRVDVKEAKDSELVMNSDLKLFSGGYVGSMVVYSGTPVVTTTTYYKMPHKAGSAADMAIAFLNFISNEDEVELGIPLGTDVSAEAPFARTTYDVGTHDQYSSVIQVTNVDEKDITFRVQTSGGYTKNDKTTVYFYIILNKMR